MNLSKLIWLFDHCRLLSGFPLSTIMRQLLWAALWPAHHVDCVNKRDDAGAVWWLFLALTERISRACLGCGSTTLTIRLS